MFFRHCCNNLHQLRRLVKLILDNYLQHAGLSDMQGFMVEAHNRRELQVWCTYGKEYCCLGRKKTCFLTSFRSTSLPSFMLCTSTDTTSEMAAILAQYIYIYERTQECIVLGPGALRPKFQISQKPSVRSIYRLFWHGSSLSFATSFSTALEVRC